MGVKFKCAGCGKHILVSNEENYGRSCKCPNCRRKIGVPRLVPLSQRIMVHPDTELISTDCVCKAGVLLPTKPGDKAGFRCNFCLKLFAIDRTLAPRSEEATEAAAAGDEAATRVRGGGGEGGGAGRKKPGDPFKGETSALLSPLEGEKAAAEGGGEEDDVPLSFEEPPDEADKT